MEKAELSLQELQGMLLHLSRRMVESKDLLTQADKVIGDGDHGIGMARGFEATRQRLEGQSFASVGEMLKAMGMALLTSVGGASGAIFATFFRGGAKGLSDRQFLDSSLFSLFLCDGLQAVKERGQAKVGDKTMVDALEPAAERSRELVSAPLDQAMAAVARAAEQGMERTKEMVATLGRAKTLGERSLGHPDPGAVSTYLMLRFMAEYVDQLHSREG